MFRGGDLELFDYLKEEEWRTLLKEEFSKEYMQKLTAFLTTQQKQGGLICPAMEDLFTAFNLTPFSRVKVVIVGQDPYHGVGQAHGLSFSVRPGVKIPPSLKNIFKELHNDMHIEPPQTGYLIEWAQQGVLLINSVLTVEAGKANSHRNKGWEIFTDRVIQLLANHKEHVIFVLWGKPAQKKALNLIDNKRHLILTAAHPSPLSAHNGFWGCRHFSKINRYLQEHGQKSINWEIR